MSARAQRNYLRTWLPVIGVFCFGLIVGLLMNLPAFASPGHYKSDILQSPHWAAYHQSSFQPDDLILHYASFNESPLQNAIYWIATWFVEFVLLTKLLSILSYGVLAATFFLVGRALYGTRCGLLLALFIVAFPDQWDYSSGFFSKFWAIPSLLVCVYILQTERWKGLVALLPFAAVAYPTAAVMIGMTSGIYWLQEYFRDRTRAFRLFRYLAIGSVLALAILMVKYISPPDGIGPMRPGAELSEMPEVQPRGYPSHYVPIPSLASQLVAHVENPFILLNALLFLMVLGRGIAWERSWTALFFASAIGYLLAELLFFKLYVPNRYVRYSLAVLLALWNARNWDLILAEVRSKWTRYAMALALVVCGVSLYSDSYIDGRGWTDRSRMVAVSRFVRLGLPEGILFAGNPKYLDDLMIQARRSVLCPYKLAHPWFTEYYDTIRERTRATLRAHFADGPGPLNELQRRYGVTHFLVDKKMFATAARNRRLFAEPYSTEVYEELGGRREFYLESLPDGVFIWEDERYAIVELPVR